MNRLAAYVKSRMVRRLLWRTLGFTLLAFMLLAALELGIERQAERADVHRRALAAAELAIASIEHAVWTYDQPNLQLAVQSLLHEPSIVAVRIDTPEATMRLQLARPDAPAVDAAHRWSLPLRAPGGLEEIGRVEVGESFRQVEADTLARAAYRLPIELLKVLGIVIGLTLVAHGQVVARLGALARQLRALEASGGHGPLVDVGARRHGGHGGSDERDEIGELAAALNEFLAQRESARTSELARERAEASSAAKSELLSRISHELRTPLNAIVGFAHVLLQDPLVSADPVRADRVGLIGKAGRHLAGLIGDLMDFSRMERGRERVQLQPAAVRMLCRDALALVAADAGAAGVTLTHRYADDAAWACADPTRLGQVLLNLLSNAIKYNRPHGWVTLTTARAADGRVEIRVVDNGIGMSPAQLAALYQPFNRLGREATPLPGTGLGLVISRRLVELMAGELVVESVAHEGSSFTIRLPASPPPGPEAVVAGAEGEGVEDAPAAPRSTVLYVEDDPVNVEVMRAVLGGQPQIELRVAESIAEARAALGARVPDLLLLDMHLPDGDGTELLRWLRRESALAALQVLVVSADAEEEGLERALAAGADGYLAKPLDFGGLVLRLRRLLARERSGSEA